MFLTFCRNEILHCSHYLYKSLFKIIVYSVDLGDLRVAKSFEGMSFFFYFSSFNQLLIYLNYLTKFDTDSFDYADRMIPVLVSIWGFKWAEVIHLCEFSIFPLISKYKRLVGGLAMK